MDYQIIKMNDNTWRVEDHGVRFFLLAGRDKALLIDSGMQVHNAKEIAESLGVKKTRTFLIAKAMTDLGLIAANGRGKNKKYYLV